ncbi:hypothetical protein B0H13DRAFT_2313124 [Mycena leptocephala]|nr:hypothetical protein B0H13DRAFT_2313124 [Mycena leptocephala]
MSTSLLPLDSITGAPLVGTWASSLLYTAEMLQAVYYFRHSKKDDWKLKLSPSSSTPSLHWETTLPYISLHHNSRWRVGDLAYLSKQNWPFPALKDPLHKHRDSFHRTVWIFTQVAADLIIAGALVYEFQKAKSNFLESRRQIQNTLNRLVVLTLQTGSATAVIAVAALIIFSIFTAVPVGIMYSLGRIYVLSMLLNLNIRVSPLRTVLVPRKQTASGAFNSEALFTSQLHTASRHDLNGTFKSSSTMSHTAEGPPAEIEMTATESSKKQSDLLV